MPNMVEKYFVMFLIFLICLYVLLKHHLFLATTGERGISHLAKTIYLI